MSWVKEVALTARVFGADESLRHGFVSAVHASKAAAVADAVRIAALIAEKSPLGTLGTKALINYSLDHPTAQGEPPPPPLPAEWFADPGPALDYTRIWNGAAIQAPDPAEAIRATFAKTKGVYAKL